MGDEVLGVGGHDGCRLSAHLLAALRAQLVDERLVDRVGALAIVVHDASSRLVHGANRDSDDAADREALAASAVDHPALDDEVEILGAVHYLETPDHKVAAGRVLRNDVAE